MTNNMSKDLLHRSATKDPNLFELDHRHPIHTTGHLAFNSSERCSEVLRRSILRDTMTADTSTLERPRAGRSMDERDIELDALSFGGKGQTTSRSSISLSETGEVVDEDESGYSDRDGSRLGKAGTLKKTVEWRWMGALFWLMFLAGKSGLLSLDIRYHREIHI